MRELVPEDYTGHQRAESIVVTISILKPCWFNAEDYLISSAIIQTGPILAILAK